MSPAPDDDPSRSFANQPRKRRRFSVWTILAPAAVVVLWIGFFSALGNSCMFKECASSKSEKSSEEVGDKRNDLPVTAKVKVKSGDSLGSIAAKYDLTEEELKACNPLVDPQALQPGAYLRVSGEFCEDADLAKTGANPDPLAGDTTAGAAPDPTDNGTAAADPSAQKDAPTTTSADQGDEG